MKPFMHIDAKRNGGNNRKRNGEKKCRVSHTHRLHYYIYVNKRGNEKTLQTIHKSYIQPCILLISRALRDVQFVLPTLHKSYTNPTWQSYTKHRKEPAQEPCTELCTRTLHFVFEHESREGSKCVVCCEGVSKCTFWLHPQRCVRMAKMQGAEDEGAGSVLKYMTKPESDSNEADWLL